MLVIKKFGGEGHESLEIKSACEVILGLLIEPKKRYLGREMIHVQRRQAFEKPREVIGDIPLSKRRTRAKQPAAKAG
jgi:hypothetical protein